MKLILSRKGFDAAAGKCPSPIFEDGSFLSLPIPDESSTVSYAEIGGPHPIGRLVEDLSPQVKASWGVHLDPDLRLDSLKREPGWRPMFGQADAAQQHLRNMKVTKEDIFLFFGWFRRVERRDGRFCYQREAPHLHMIFGWLKVGEVWRKAGEIWHDSEDKILDIPNWAKEHPHLSPTFNPNVKENTIYVAAETSTGFDAGTLKYAVGELMLTREGESRSRWRLPSWFYPSEGKSSLSYHSNGARWTPHENEAHLQTVGRGQEFVLDTEEYPEAVEWVNDLIETNRASTH
jgi:hypothetical protein